MRAVIGVATAVVLAAAVAMVLAASNARRRDDRGANVVASTRQTHMAAMHDACVTAMISSTCQAMVGSAPADAATTVLIAGVGRIDAKAYRALREAGDAMCGIARTSCEAAWDGAPCRSARALWSTQQIASAR